jgi:hypothetical protein
MKELLHRFALFVLLPAGLWYAEQNGAKKKPA